MAASPTQRTLEHYRAQGYAIGVVERFVAQAGPYGKRFDLFGFIDLIAMDGDVTTAIQATSASNVSARVKKILSIPEAQQWVSGPNRHLIVIGWKKYAKRVNGKLWRYVYREIGLGDFDAKT